MASQWHTGRNDMHRCLFVYGDDGNHVFELQRDESDNIASVSVRLLDLVELEPTAFQVSFSAVPWLSARVRNNGLVTANEFKVDFYQVRWC